MKSNEQFNGLNGVKNVTRNEIIEIIELAKQENNLSVIYRLSRILNSKPDADLFNIEIIEYPKTGLNGAQHTGDYKEALDDCGRLRKGFKFQGGKVVKVAPKVKPTKAKKVAPAKPEIKKIYAKDLVPNIERVERMIEIELPSEIALYHFKKYESQLLKENNIDLASGLIPDSIRNNDKYQQLKKEYNKAENITKQKRSLFTKKDRNINMVQRNVDLQEYNKRINAIISDLDKKQVTPKPVVKKVALKPKVESSTQLKLLAPKKQKPVVERTAVENAVIVSFDFNSKKIDNLHKLEEKLRNAISNHGQYDGHLIPLKNGKAEMYFYGKNADNMYEAIKVHLQNNDVFNKGIVELRYGDTENQTKKSVFKSIVVNKSKKLNAPIPAVENNSVPKNSLAYRLQNKGNVKHEYYKICSKDIAEFLGNIEKKTKESVAITIAGGQGSMKTRLCFQLMNDFAQNYKVGHASIEEHPESALYEDKIHQYLNAKALQNISAPEINSIDDVHKLVKENDVIIIDSFSKLQEMQKGCELDKDFRKAYNGKLFIIIYQLTSDNKMRGGSKSQFDGDIISFIQKESDYKQNYCYHDKNRYNRKSLDELKFNIFSGKLLQPETEQQNEVKPVEKIDFSFNVK